MAPSKPLPAAKDAPTWSGPLVQASITLPCVAIAVGAYMAAEAEVAHARRFGDAHLLHAVLLHPPLVMTVLAVAQLVCSMVAQRNFTTLRRLILVLLLLSSLGGMALGFVGPALRPTLSGTVEHTVAGVSGPVHLTRDENHLLHIHAATRRDAYFGQGYAVAQDRLFQMEFHRLIARGDLARVVGPAALPYDRKMRTLNILGASEQLCALADPAVMDLVQAFTDGINLYLEQDHTRPIEFFLMSRSLLAGHEPEPYAPLDVCLALRLFAYEICVNADREAMRFNLWVGTNRTYAEVDELFLDLDAQANSVLSVEQMLSLLVEDPATLTAEEKQAMLAKLAEAEKRSVELEALIYDGLLALMKPALRAERGLEPSTNDEDAATAALIEETHRKHAMHVEDLNPDASNLWATRDAQGRAMVSSDPHLVMRAPSVWFFAHLHFMTEDGAPFDVAGVVLPGVPGVHIGTSSHLAWGFTTSKTDLQDLFIFPPASWRGSPTANTSYVYDGQEHTFTRRQEIIHVKGREAPEVLEVEDSLFGPVVSHLHGYMQPTALFKTALFATPLQSDDAHSLAAILGMSDPAVRTAHDMMERVVELQAPGFSIISADRQGSIAYATTGRYPRRAPGHTGKIPTPAFDALGVLRAVCRHFGSTAAHDAEEDLVVELRACVASILPTLKEEELLPIIQDALRTTSTTWKTFVHGPAERARSGANFARHPSSMNPHLSLPFDGKAAHFSSANQRIMPSPYAFFLSADYAPSYRGRRLQELLQTAQDGGTSHDASVHRRIQLDIQSNVWMFDLRHVVESEAFVAALTRVAPTSSSWATWRERLLAWDGIAVIGSEEVSFMWRWMERMSVLPRDAIRALKLTQWEPQTGHMMRMLRRPSARMESECAAYLHDVHHTTVEHRGACVHMAALLFDAEAESGRRQAWGIDANRVTASHELFRSGFLAKLFEMAMAKGGDFTSLAVSQHTASGSFPSTKASSVRQIFDLWNHTEHVRLSFPGGNSGIPFSSGYDTLWARFEAEEYVHVKARGHVEGQTHGHQLLIPRDHSA